MALRRCDNCGNLVSSSATHCPKCDSELSPHLWLNDSRFYMYLQKACGQWMVISMRGITSDLYKLDAARPITVDPQESKALFSAPCRYFDIYVTVDDTLVVMTPLGYDRDVSSIRNHLRNNLDQALQKELSCFSVNTFTWNDYSSVFAIYECLDKNVHQHVLQMLKGENDDNYEAIETSINNYLRTILQNLLIQTSAFAYRIERAIFGE